MVTHKIDLADVLDALSTAVVTIASLSATDYTKRLDYLVGPREYVVYRDNIDMLQTYDMLEAIELYNGISLRIHK